MKVIKFLCLITLIGLFNFGCSKSKDATSAGSFNTYTLKISDLVDSFSLNYHLNATYIPDTANYIEYTCRSSIKDKLKFITKGNGIQISASNTLDPFITGETLIDIHSKSLRFIDLVDFCSFNNYKLISAPSKTLYISQAQNCSCTVNINTTNIITNISGGCYTSISGGCTKLSLVPINSASNFDGQNLFVRNAFVNTSTNCNLNLNVSTTLDVFARSGCTINYYGSPLVTQDISSDCKLVKK